MSKHFVLGIGGASRTGKTTLAREIQAALPRTASSILLHQDDYIREAQEIPSINGYIDWEHPESLDFGRLQINLRKCRRTFDIVIVEGFMIFWDHTIADMMDLRIFLNIDRREFLKRRKRDKRYGPEEDWYIDHVWDSYLKYGQKPADLPFSRLRNPVSIAEHIMQSIR